MKNVKWVFGLLSVLLFTLPLLFPISTKAASLYFRDVRGNEWFMPALQLGMQEEIVKGYPDGTFRPSNEVTEAEFLAMLFRALDFEHEAMLKYEDQAQHGWYDPYFYHANDLAIYSSRNKPDEPVRRGVVARTIATVYGHYAYKQLDPEAEEEAISFLLQNKLTKGKTAPTIEGYAKDDYLTRVEALQFILNIKKSPLKPVRTVEDIFNKDKLLNALRTFYGKKNTEVSSSGIAVTYNKEYAGKMDGYVLDMNFANSIHSGDLSSGYLTRVTIWQKSDSFQFFEGNPDLLKQIANHINLFYGIDLDPDGFADAILSRMYRTGEDVKFKTKLGTPVWMSLIRTSPDIEIRFGLFRSK